MLLCGICNITLLSCKFGNSMVQHKDGLIHKELSNAQSCMIDDEFCVFRNNGMGYLDQIFFWFLESKQESKLGFWFF